MTPTPTPHRHAPTPLPRAARESEHTSDDLPASSRDPSVTQTLRGLVKIWPVLGAILGASIGVYVQTVRLEARVDSNAAAIAAIGREVGSKAASSDLTRLEADRLRDRAEHAEIDRRVIEKLDTMSATLERVCARVQCGRVER